MRGGHSKIIESWKTLRARKPKVGKITDFGLKKSKGFRKRAAHPHPIFLGVPPPPGTFFVLWSEIGVIVPGVPCGHRGNWE